MPSPDDDDNNPFDEFAEPTVEEIRAPVSTSIKPEVAAALAALKPARSPSSPSLPPPSSSLPPPSSSSSSFSAPRPRPTTSPSLAPPVRTPTASTKAPPANGSWSPPRIQAKPILWGTFIVGAVLVCIGLLRTKPVVSSSSPTSTAEASAPVGLFGHDALLCTRVTVRGQRVECAFTPQQLGKLDEAERRSRLEASRKQAGAAGYTGVVLVDNGRVWRVLHAEEVASRQKPR